MTEPPWREVRARFEALVDLDEEQQRLELTRLDPAVGARVASLLEEERASRAFLDEDQRRAALDSVGGLTAGERVAGFYLVRELGRGGMATVYEAEQDTPRRRVALKLLRTDVSSVDSASRFAFEAEVLGRLRHPHIAQVYEFGVHERLRRPFFALEFVEDARDLVTYAREQELDLGGRLELFLPVTQAVAFGHRKGVIHRDLKPANLLVDGEGQVKVIDFGIARPLPGSLLARSLNTETGQLLGTLATMAPEQLAGDPSQVDTRADVYALGCVLYELLEEQPPIDVEGEPITKAIRRLRDEDPRRPSRVPREMAWILGRALEKDPDRRYPSVEALAADLARFRVGEPLIAAPPSLVYRTRKYVLRHRTGVTSLAAVFLALSVGLWTTDGQRQRALHAEQTQRSLREEAEEATQTAEDRADEARRALAQLERQAQRTRAVKDLLIDMFDNAGGPDATASQLLHAAKDRLPRLFEELPGTRGTLEMTLGKLFLGVEELQAGKQLMEAAVKRVREELPPEDSERIVLELDFLLLLFREGRLEEAADLVLHLAPLLEAGGYSARTRANQFIRLGAIRAQQRRHEEALVAYEEGHRIYADAGLLDEPDTWRALGGMSISLCSLFRPEEALGFAEEALEQLARILGKLDQELTLPLGQLALGHSMLGHWDQAIEFHQRNLKVIESSHGPLAPPRVGVLADLTSCLVNSGDEQRAQETAELLFEAVDALPAEQRAWASAREALLVTRLELARLAAGRGDHESSVELLEELIAVDELEGPAVSSNLTQAHVNLAMSYRELGDVDAAFHHMERSLALDELGLRLRADNLQGQLGFLFQLAEETDRGAEFESYRGRLNPPRDP